MGHGIRAHGTASFAAALGCALAPLSAQTAPTLREIVRTFALGGNCERIDFATGGGHLLTVGEFGDVCWWDLTKQSLERRFEPRGRYVTAVAIHPTEPWAAIGISSHGELDEVRDGCVFRFDLATGEVRRVFSHYVEALAFDARGANLGALESESPIRRRVITIPTERLDGAAEPAPTRCSDWGQWLGPFRIVFRSADGHAEIVPRANDHGVADTVLLSRSGTATGSCTPSEARSFRPRRRAYSLAPFVDSWIEHAAIGDDGTLAAADVQGQLLVMTPDAAQPTVHAPHLGAAHRLVFSPDGRILAIAGLGAVRCVDLAGKEIATREGTQVVVPGTAGAEFFLMTRTEWRRWNAAAPRMPGIVEQLGEPWVPRVAENRATHASNHLTLAPVLAIDDLPWCATAHYRFTSPRPVRFGPSGRIPLAADDREPGEMLAACRLANGDVALLWSHDSDESGDRPASCTVHLHDRGGAALGARTLERIASWLCPAGDDLLLGTIDGTVRRLRGRDLTVEDADAFTPPLRQVEPFGPNRLLATNGPSLLLLDAESLAVVHTFGLPEGIDGVDVFGLASDRSHLAIARSIDVRILTLEGK